jgi:hypothetical protein
MYLIFSSEEAAWNRSEQEGISMGLAYHTQGRGSRYVTAPQETADHMWALDVSDYALDESEESATVDTYLPLEVEDDT